ncbi:MAG: nitrilase-related carbon-nitrogen hydrolase [Bacteriovoracaceae bacterium]
MKKLLMQSMVLSMMLIMSLTCMAQAKTLNIAVANFTIKGGNNLAGYLKRIEDLSIESRNKGAKYLLLPELMVFELFPVDLKEEETKKYLDQVAAISKDIEEGMSNISLKHGINLIGASIVIKKDKHFINRSYYITDTGVVNYQDKVQPTPWEAKFGFIGSDKIKLFKDSNFNFVILICYDAEFPTISAALMKNKPEIIFVPSQTGSIYGLNRVKLTSAARAVEHMSYVFMTGVSGDLNAPWHAYAGQNFLFTPQNEYFSKEVQTGAFNVETLSIFSIDMKKLKDARLDPKEVYPSRDAKVIK